MITVLSISSIVSEIAGALWGWPMVILLLGTHIFLTIRLKFPQRKIFKAIKLSFTKDENSTGDVSQFAALATSLMVAIYRSLLERNDSRSKFTPSPGCLLRYKILLSNQNCTVNTIF